MQQTRYAVRTCGKTGDGHNKKALKSFLAFQVAPTDTCNKHIVSFNIPLFESIIVFPDKDQLLKMIREDKGRFLTSVCKLQGEINITKTCFSLVKSCVFSLGQTAQAIVGSYCRFDM